MPTALPSDDLDRAHVEEASASLSRAPKPVGEFWRGCRLGLPILLGYAPVGAAFGILARQTGFSVLAAGVCSATALAGAGQFIALSSLAAGGGALTALIATTVVNLRYVLFAATLSPSLPAARGPMLAWLGFTLTDETFAVNVTDIRSRHATAASMAGVGAISWFGWVAGTLVGALAADAIGDPSRFGVGFAMPAMFSALFVALAEDRRHIVVGVGAGLVALALPLLSAVGLNVPSSWFVVIASIAAATVASAVIRDE
jgi:4-azaleucine resistance transporter AzlC